MSSVLFEQRFATTAIETGNFYSRCAEPSIQKNVSHLLDRRIQVVVTKLKSSSHQQIGIEELARLVNLSPSRLAHLFKSETRLSIQQYLTRLRLAKAKQQLESSFLSIKEIAASVGFSSVTRFGSCFKNLVGTTPAQYRKRVSMMSHQGAERIAVARSANT